MDKSQIWQNLGDFFRFLCRLCFLTEAVSPQNTTVPSPQIPMKILRDVQGPGHVSVTCGCCCGTWSSSVPPHAGVAPGSSALQNVPPHLHSVLGSIPGAKADGVQTDKDAERGKGEDLFSTFAMAQLQAMDLRCSKGRLINSEMREQPARGACKWLPGAVANLCQEISKEMLGSAFSKWLRKGPCRAFQSQM